MRMPQLTGSVTRALLSRQKEDGCHWSEGIWWTLGYLLAQVIVLSSVLFVILSSVFGLTWPGRKAIFSLILDLNLDRSFLLVGVSSLGVLFLIVPMVRWREGKDFRRKIGWGFPSREELVYSLATVIPTAMLGDLVYRAATQWFTSNSSLAFDVRETSLAHLYRSIDGVPYPILVVALALGPAIGEELVFRGVLGRRLVARYGVLVGVLGASAFFAAAHVSPAHALATLPVGIVLHLLYLQTGTIWIPMLGHFCNNLLVISMVHFQLGTPAPESNALLLSLTVYLASMIALLHQKKRRWAET